MVKTTKRATKVKIILVFLEPQYLKKKKKIFHLTFNQSFTEENGLSRHLVYYSPCWKHLNQSFALEVAKFFYKEPESKYFSISGHIVAATTIQLCGGKAAIDINE